MSGIWKIKFPETRQVHDFVNQEKTKECSSQFLEAQHISKFEANADADNTE